MNRELIRCSEGFWNLIDDFEKLICRFKVGDRVKATFKTLTKGEATEEVIGKIHEICFGLYGYYLTIFTENGYFLPVEIEDIVSMEGVS